MTYELPFACISTDSGLASSFLHVSPVYVRIGPPTRGRFADRRAARARRTDARHARRAVDAIPASADRFDRFFEPAS